MYIKLTNGIPETQSIAQLRQNNPQVSFPSEVSNSVLAEYGMFPLTVLPRPEIDENTQFLKASEFYQVDDNWYQQYLPENLPETQAADNIRSLRNQRLSKSDWTQVADAPVDKAAWASYRQALRDVTTQTEFPLNVSWPIKPT